jgi:hypothetical protein
LPTSPGGASRSERAGGNRPLRVFAAARTATRVDCLTEIFVAFCVRAPAATAQASGRRP